MLESFEVSFTFFCSWREERRVSDRRPPPELEPAFAAPEFSGCAEVDPFLCEEDDPLISTLSRCLRNRTGPSVGVASPDPGGLWAKSLKVEISTVGEGRAERGVSILDGRETGDSLARSSLLSLDDSVEKLCTVHKIHTGIAHTHRVHRY